MDASRRRVEQLAVELDDELAQIALERAIAAVPGESAALVTGIACLAIGDHQFARRLLERIDGEEYLLLVARHLLWTGHAGFFRSQLPRIEDVLMRVQPFAELHELAIALESVGAAHAVAPVRVMAAAATRTVLPAWTGEAWPDLARIEPAEGVAAFVHGTLGAAPDAPRGRLRLRPWLPHDARRISVENLHLGDATVNMLVEQSASSVRYRLEQTAGAMPVRLIFEPALTRMPSAIFVDDQPADLAQQPFLSRIIAPVQLMLDHQRTLDMQLT